MEEFDRIALGRKSHVATPEESGYNRDQYTMVQSNQGGDSNTAKTKQHLEYKQLVQWNRENLTILVIMVIFNIVFQVGLFFIIPIMATVTFMYLS